jgi:hypothetical protein
MLSSQWLTNTAEDLSAAAADHGSQLIPMQIRLIEVNFTVTTAVAADTTAPQVIFQKTDRDGTTDTNICTMTIPDGAAVGNVYYNDLVANNVTVANCQFEVGQRLTYNHATQAVDSTAAAGAGHYGAVFVEERNTADYENEQVSTTS